MFFIRLFGEKFVVSRCNIECKNVVVILVVGLNKNILINIGILLKLIFKKLKVGMIGKVKYCKINVIVVNIVIVIIFCIWVFFI